MRHDGLVGERGRPWWLVVAVAVPVGLPLLGRWQAVLAFVVLVVVVVGPVYVAQWWNRRRERVAHAAGVETWNGHLPLERAVGLWEFGVGAAFLFGGGVPVRLTARPAGLTVTIRGPVAGRRHVPVTVQWSDIVAARAQPAGRVTEWGRVALLPLTMVTFDLVHGADAFVVTTHDAGGLVELVRSRAGPAAQGEGGSQQIADGR